jgi:DNA-binding SARP family transcriptional activator
VTPLSCEGEFVDKIEIRLLGRPSVTINGVVARPPRGAKAWGLLSYLAAPERSRSRSELADLLFAAAEDPLGALRWNLAALRRLLGLPDVLKGDPLRLDLPEGATVDMRLLDAGDPAALDEPGIGQELLTGLSFSDSPMFEMWLVTVRRRLERRSASLLRDAALAASARREHEIAVRYATELVAQRYSWPMQATTRNCRLLHARFSAPCSAWRSGDGTRLRLRSRKRHTSPRRSTGPLLLPQR